MATLQFTAVSEQDLDAIWLYIAKDSINHADKLIDTLILKCHLLAEHPKMGIKRPELASDVYSFPIERYKVFYSLANESGIIIQRIIHSSRDISNIDFN